MAETGKEGLLFLIYHLADERVLCRTRLPCPSRVVDQEDLANSKQAIETPFPQSAHCEIILLLNSQICRYFSK
jgi:hypothetical protein